MSADEITEARRRRLHELELRAERQGYQTPPEVANEIADIRHKLAGIEDATMASANLYLPENMRLLSVEKAVENLNTKFFWIMIGMAAIQTTSLFLSIIALILVNVVRQ